MTPGTSFECDLALLRERFLSVARRRVDAEALEDIVQRALQVVVENAGDAPVKHLPALAWCFQVLRNTIGNYYQKRRTDRRIERGTAMHDAQSGLPTPLEALEASEASAAIHAALDALGAGDATCGRYLARLMEGTSPRALAVDEGLIEAVLYRRVYRCRAKLRQILLEKGVLP